MANQRLVISVGQCGYDNSRLQILIRSIDPDLIFQATDTAQEAFQLMKSKAGQTALLLVNRVFDADGASGLGLIQEITRDSQAAHPPVMLVSNYEDAQASAIAHGALPGFGKSSLGHAETANRIKSALGIK
ncbi:MAG: hypothetical protein ACKO5E_07120 [bacterium]